MDDDNPIMNPASSSNFQISSSVRSRLDDHPKLSRTCSHTHTCNPPGPAAKHTHTCYHTHTQIIAAEEDDRPNKKEQSSLKPREPSGNVKAVRKYRQKKKAQMASLEDEVKRLQQLNKQLAMELQKKAVLQDEASRLRTLLAEIKGKIDDQLGVSPFQNQCSNGGGSNLSCEADFWCLKSQLGSSTNASIDHYFDRGNMVFSNCHSAERDCQNNMNIIASTGSELQSLIAVGEAKAELNDTAGQKKGKVIS